MKEFMINKKEAGSRLDKYLFKVLNQAPKSFIFKMLRKKNIVLNDKKAQGQEVLMENDSIKIYFSDETFDKFASEMPEREKSDTAKASSSERFSGNFKMPDIIYEDEDVLILNKPVGVLSQKAQPGDYSANEMVIDYLLKSGQLRESELRTFRPSVCNRLDRNTSGLLIAGKTMHGLQEMSRMLKDRDVRKFYRCIVNGTIAKDAHLKGYLVKNTATNKVEILQKQTEHASRIETAYHPICSYNGYTLLEVHLITGRTHQIRAHLSSIGHPILGDEKYGNKKQNRKLRQMLPIEGQLLHAYRMEFPDGRIMIAPEPELFRSAEKILFQGKELPVKQYHKR